MLEDYRKSLISSVITGKERVQNLMNKLKPTEGKFESHIEKFLNTQNFKSFTDKSYDKNLCLNKDEILGFIKSTQKESWDKLKEIYGEDVDKKVLDRISAEISNRGIIEVLRNQIVDRGVYIDLCYFEPKSNLNEDHFNLLKKIVLV